MEYFDWLSSVQMIYMFFLPTPRVDNEAQYAQAYRNMLAQSYRVAIIVAIALFIAGLVLGGIGLSKLAKKEKKTASWLGFLPFGNTYLTGQIAGEAHFFGQKMKRVGLYAMLAEIAYVLLETVCMITRISVLPYMQVSFVEQFEGMVMPQLDYDRAGMTASVGWLYDFQILFDGLAYLAMFIKVILFCVMFIALYRKYFATKPVFMALLSSVFPFRSIVLFAVRNNSPVDYHEFMRQRAEEYMRRHPQYRPYGGYGYPNQNQQWQQPNGQGPSQEPFSDFPSEDKKDKGEPFDEF